MIRDALSASQTKSVKIKFERQKRNVLLPAAGVLVEMSAGEALVTTSSPQNSPSFLSTADLDPVQV